VKALEAPVGTVREGGFGIKLDEWTEIGWGEFRKVRADRKQVVVDMSIAFSIFVEHNNLGFLRKLKPGDPIAILRTARDPGSIVIRRLSSPEPIREHEPSRRAGNFD